MEQRTLSLGITKAAPPEGLPADDGLTWFKITSGIVDRDQEVLDPDGMKVDRFMADPVVLWGHDHTIPPIGNAPRLVKGTDAAWYGGVRFADGEKYPFAGLIKYLVEDGFLHAVSIRFIPLKWEDADPVEAGYRRKYTEFELLEFSIVNIPANPEALRAEASDAKAADANLGPLFIKIFGDALPGDATPKAKEAAGLEAAPQDHPTPGEAEAAPAKAGAELSKKNRATLGSIRDSLSQAAATLGDLLAKWEGDDEADGKTAGDPAEPDPDPIKALTDKIDSILAAVTASPAAPAADDAPAQQGTLPDLEEGRREKTATLSGDELRDLVRSVVTDGINRQRGIVTPR